MFTLNISEAYSSQCAWHCKRQLSSLKSKQKWNGTLLYPNNKYLTKIEINRYHSSVTTALFCMVDSKASIVQSRGCCPDCYQAIRSCRPSLHFFCDNLLHKSQFFPEVRWDSSCISEWFTDRENSTQSHDCSVIPGLTQVPGQFQIGILFCPLPTASSYFISNMTSWPGESSHSPILKI